VPLRAAGSEPNTLALDPRIEVAGTAPFDGIAGYLRHLPSLTRANRPILRRAIEDADLVWIKVPASNAALAAALAVRAHVPRLTWVAGSAAAVGLARARGARALATGGIGLLYDAIGAAAGVGGCRITVGDDLLRPDGGAGGGIVTSLVEAADLLDPAQRSYPRDPSRVLLAWAGRVAEGKGLEWLLRELRQVNNLGAGGRRVELVLVGDGPARPALAALSAQLGLDDLVHWRGYLSERQPYLDALASADAFVHPSTAEGFPKVVLDAMAVGLPVLARPAGMLAQLGRGAGSPIIPLADSLADALGTLGANAYADGQSGWIRFADQGHDFVQRHTRGAEAAAVVALIRTRWPALPWP
jgi:hypothetical protein